MGIMNYKFGIILGFMFGLITPYLAALGLGSQIGGLLGLILGFPGIVIGNLFVFQVDQNTFSSSIAMPFAMMFNGVLYGLIGWLLQTWLKKKIFVACIFGGIIVLIIIAMIIETIIRSSLGLHVGP